jgi:hypothetical protein
MALAVAGTFGSLPEAHIAFSSLESAGFHPVAGFAMNTPGVAGGMSPSAYRVLVLEDEVQAAREFIAELMRELSNSTENLREDTALEAGPKDTPGHTLLGRLRLIAPYFAATAIALWLALIWLTHQR